MPVAATALGSLEVATVGWRLRGRLYLTVVTKATFALVPEGRMTLVKPTPIVDREVHGPSGEGLSAASDLAPFLGQAEIVVTGHVQVPASFAQSSLRVQLAVVQQGALCVDKQLDLPVHAPGASALRVGGMGPISNGWPLRQRWLNGADARFLDQPLPEIPEAVHWEYFQTSPQDQRMPRIVGDEWIVLGGMLLRRPRFRAQLPDARGVARLYRAALPAPREGEPIALHADTLHVDVDALRCSILWRGRVELSGAEDLDALHVIGALEQPGKPIVWEDPIEAAVEEVEQVDEGMLIGSTVGISPEVVRRLAAAAATPFQPAPLVALATGPKPVPVNLSSGVTLTLEDDVRLLLAGSAATPFKAPPRAEMPNVGATPSPRVPVALPQRGPLDSTFELPTNIARLLAERAATPFDAAVPNMGAALPVDEADARLLSRLATPSQGLAGLAPSFPPTMDRPRDGVVARASDPLNATFELPTDFVRALARRLATPFDAARPAIADAIAESPPRSAITPAAGDPPRIDLPMVAVAQVDVGRVGQDSHTPAAHGAPPFEEEDEALGELGAEFLAALAESG